MSNYKDNKSLKHSLAKIISYILEAPILALFVFFILNFFLDNEKFLQIGTISLLFGTILPIVLFVSWSKIKKIDKDYTIKESRNYPFIIGIVIYFIGTFILFLSSANPLTTALMFCYGSNTLIVFFINLKWKISVHAMGVTGPTTTLMFFTPWGFLLGLLAPLVMWSRITLKKHTINQLLAGAILGYISTFIQIYYLLKIANFNLNIDITLTTCLIFGLILLSLISSLIIKKK